MNKCVWRYMAQEIAGKIAGFVNVVIALALVFSPVWIGGIVISLLPEETQMYILAGAFVLLVAGVVVSVVTDVVRALWRLYDDAVRYCARKEECHDPA